MQNVKAKQVLDIVGLEDGTVIAISSTEFNIVKHGTLRIVDENDLDSATLDAFDEVNSRPNKPKYPYMVEFSKPVGDDHE
jgi:hypothetical protein